MSTNSEMTAIMASEGFAADRQRFLRGGASADAGKYWIAVKESQNLILNQDGSFKLWMRRADGTRHSKAWKVHAPHTSRLTVWMKRRQSRLWVRLGKYTFGEVVEEHHDVTKRGKAYHTDICRVATRVA